MRFLRFFILLSCLLISWGTARALTIAVGGNIEDTSLRTDQMTVDMCTYVYDCSHIRYVSLPGKLGSIAPGKFQEDNLKAAYVNKADKSQDADYTDKAVWGDNGLSDQTKLSGAFTSQWINYSMTDNAQHAPFALGANTAPSADQALWLSQSAEVIDTIYKTDLYSTATSAGGAGYTNHAMQFDSGYIFEHANTANTLYLPDNNYTRY